MNEKLARVIAEVNDPCFLERLRLVLHFHGLADARVIFTSHSTDSMPWCESPSMIVMMARLLGGCFPLSSKIKFLMRSTLVNIGSINVDVFFGNNNEKLMLFAKLCLGSKSQDNSRFEEEEDPWA